MFVSGRRKLKKLLGFAAIVALTGPASAQTPATLNDYWVGNAQWDFVRKWTPVNSGAMSNVSSHISVVNGTWYMFVREFVNGGATCTSEKTKGIHQLGMRAYRSDDKGATWTQASQLSLAPRPGADYSCQATDGDAYYDADQNKWRFLFQCLNDDNVYQGCYAERAGADPMGPFDSNPQYGEPAPERKTAVIRSGALWGPICYGNELSGCYGIRVAEEGTFNIFRKDASGYFWVAFHGYDGRNGYRSIAKTTDFRTWVAGNVSLGVPDGPTMSARDAVNWKESWAGGNIGAGAGSIVETGGYTYQVVEFADRNLACTANQRWDIGLFRTTNVASTTWGQPSVPNPMVLSSLAVENGVIRPCNVQYAQLFIDKSTTPHVTYLKYGRETSDQNYHGTYLYRLNASHNILKNANLRSGDVTNWQRLPASPAPNYTVYRFPNNSPDGTQYLATNCGTWTSACPAGSSFFQDVSVAAYSGRTFTFGGQFATDAGHSGSASLALWQMDAYNNVLKSDSVPIAVSGADYVRIQSPTLTLLAATKKVRYQFYHGTQGITYRAANMFVNVN